MGGALEYGAKLSAMRTRLIERLAPLATAAHREISGTGERLEIEFSPGNSDDFTRNLADSSVQESRFRQTVVGPHRDDIFEEFDPVRRNLLLQHEGWPIASVDVTRHPNLALAWSGCAYSTFPCVTSGMECR
jgi:recombinational DNA repair ATPase RecF